MSQAVAIPPGGKLGISRGGWPAPVQRAGEADEANTAAPFYKDPEDAPDPYADEPKWPAWAVGLGVVVFCGAFWAGIYFIASRLLG